VPSPSFYLKSLTLRSFRSVVDEQTIPLPSHGMHLLLGSSGAGKTTIGEGIAFALGYSNFSATDLQSWDWLTDQPLKDTLELETLRGTLRVTRGKGASILLPGEEKARTSAKAVKEGLVQALGLDPEAYLAPLTYRPQKRPGLFLDMKDSEKKAFLTKLLGLDAFEQAVERSLATISSLSAEVDRCKVQHQTLMSTVPALPPEPALIDDTPLVSKVAEAEMEYGKLRSMVEQTKSLDFELSQRQARKLEEVKQQWQPILQKVYDALQSVPAPDVGQLEHELNELGLHALMLKREHEAKVAEANSKLSAAVSSQVTATSMAARRAEVERKLKQLTESHNQLTSGQCYVCKRAWTDDPHKTAAIAGSVAAISEQEMLLGHVTAAEQVAGPLAEQVSSLQKVVSDLRGVDPIPTSLREKERQLVGTIASVKSERDARVANANADFHRVRGEAEKAIATASTMTVEEEQVRQTLGSLQNALTTADYQVRQAKSNLNNARAMNDATQKQYAVMRAQHEAAADRILLAVDNMKAAEDKLAQEQDFLGMLRGFLAYIFDETLARIADSTNARLALIPNVADITIRFASERETGTGKLRQEITAVCEKNGHVVPLRAGISGGMYTAVELAVDLSLADVIAERTGVYPGWLILDEAFEGLDTPCKAACFDMLKDISKDRAVFVVDHTNEFQELFDSKIRVDFDGGKSTVVLL
jgi:DNA repair exonuclease SbcCD ATPase subunit